MWKTETLERMEGGACIDEVVVPAVITTFRTKALDPQLPSVVPDDGTSLSPSPGVVALSQSELPHSRQAFSPGTHMSNDWPLALILTTCRCPPSSRDPHGVGRPLFPLHGSSTAPPAQACLPHLL